MFGIGSQELFVLFLVVLLLFGADRIPEVARAVGKSIREFKRAASEIETEIQQVAQQKDVLTGKREARPSRPKAPPSGAESHPGGSGDGGPGSLSKDPYPENEPPETKEE